MKIIKYLITICLIVFSSFTYASQILVSGAASLTDVFNDLANEYRKSQPELEILTSFAASDTVLQQIINGAPVDVFASADQITMDKAEKLGLLMPDSRNDFIANQLVLITPKGELSDKSIQSLDDLVELIRSKDQDLSLAVANPAFVPAGRYAKEALEDLGIWHESLGHQITGQNVRQILNYVQRGEVDAGIVFASDAFIAKDKVNIIAELKVAQPILYPIAIIGENNEAQGFINFVLSDQGQKILINYGFSKVE